MRIRLAVAASVVALSLTACATSPTSPPQSVPTVPADSWDAVVGLSWGQEIFIRLVEGGRVQGTFEAANADGVTIRAPGSPTKTIAANNVRSVDVRVVVPNTKGKWTLRGALIGTAVGIGVGILCQASDADCDLGTGLLIAVPTTAIGALWGRSAGQPSRVETVRVYTGSWEPPGHH